MLHTCHQNLPFTKLIWRTTTTNMALPISAGDAILLSKIAWRIGQAFTTGRKSAPAEFAEIQSLLSTLSEVLKVLGETSSNTDEHDQRGTINDQDEDAKANSALLGQIMMNCNSTLTHLKTIVDKYIDLDEKRDEKEERKWKDGAKKNWKKVMWTKEGGDIIKLKTTLTAHISGLSLALLTINK